MYFKYGFSVETKKKAEKLFGVDKGNIHSMNLELKQKGYLLDGIASKKEKTLNKELVQLQNYYDHCIKNGDNIKICADLLIDY